MKAQHEGAPRGEAGTSGFLCVSDSDRRVTADSDRSFAAEFEQESQASSCVEEWNSACLSTVGDPVSIPGLESLQGKGDLI